MPMIYCLIPYELADKLHAPLREHFRHEPGVEVVVEQRTHERRSGIERRRMTGSSPTGPERRHILAQSGRRVAERRAEVEALSTTTVREMPRRLRRYAAQIEFVERVAPTGERAEDADTARQIARFQSGDHEAFSVLYTRYFERVYAYLRVVLKDHHEAEDLTQDVFVRVLKALPSYERRSQPFRAWLFVIARNAARDHLVKHARVELMEANDLNIAYERVTAGVHGETEAESQIESGAPPNLAEALALSWIRNQDLLVLVERLPEAQRQVLSLRYMLGLQAKEIAKVMDLDPNHVSVLHYRAVSFLRDRLASLGRDPRNVRDAARMTRMPQKNTVLRLRRWALDN